MENLTISKENAIKAFDEANEKGKTLLKNLFGEKVFVKNIIDRIKTLEDALEYNGKTVERFNYETERDTDTQRAGKELEEIAKALREGKALKMNQRWYYPWMYKPTGSAVGFSYGDSYYDLDYAFVGARLSVDTPEKAIYMGKQFAHIYTRHLSPEVE